MNNIDDLVEIYECPLCGGAGILEEDCGSSFRYRIAAQDGIARGVLRELPLPGFPIRHDFDFLWAKESIYGGKYRRLSEELIRCRG